MNASLTQLKDFSMNADEYWVAGVVRLPGWAKDKNGPPYRIWAGFCAGEMSGAEMSHPVPAAQKSPVLAVEALVKMARRLGRLPEQFHVWQEETGELLVRQIEDAAMKVAVMVAEERHPAVDAILKDMAAYGRPEPGLPGLLTGNGVTLDQVRAFAEAAAAFCAAQPWIVFDSDEDLLRIDAPNMPTLMRYAVVLGRSGQEFGLGFYKQEADFFDAREGRISPAQMAQQSRVFLSRAFPYELPDDDADVWEDHQLPLADGQTLLPALVHPKRVDRPDAPTLALMEGILRALTTTAEADLDKGAWSREVPTSMGALTFSFSLIPLEEKPPLVFNRETMEQTLAEISRQFATGKVPGGKLLSMPMRRAARTEKTTDPRDQARELIHQAWESHGRQRVELARQALELWPDAADAYTILAREFNNPHDALNLYEKALAAAERALGPAFIEKSRGHFWGMIETRPYMRALEGLAHAQWMNGQRAEAIDGAQRALTLNPNDNQGIRYTLIGWLLAQKRDREASLLIKQFDEDSPWWTYARTLLAYRLGGDSDSARRELRTALRANRHMPKFLSGRKPLPLVRPDSYSMGNEDEAALAAHDLLPAWQATPDALAWLSSQQPAKRRRKPPT